MSESSLVSCLSVYRPLTLEKEGQMGVCPSGPGVWEMMFPTDWRKASPISADAAFQTVGQRWKEMTGSFELMRGRITLVVMIAT